MPIRSVNLKKAKIVVTAGVILLLAGAASSALIDTRPEATRAREWATRQAAVGALPTTLETIGVLPVEYRRAVMATLPAETAAELWRAHLAAVAQTPGLTADQRDLILRTRALIVPALYNTKNPDRSKIQAAIMSACPTVQTSFSDDVQWALKNIGPRPTTSSDGTLVRVAQFLQRAAGIATLRADLPDCTCADATGACDCTHSGDLCKEELCTGVAKNCGCMVQSIDCDYHCAPPSEN